MYQLNDQRQIRQEYCRNLFFKNISIHGDATTKDELPQSFIVSFVPASLQRLLDAWHAIQGGVAISGIKIRSYDVLSSIPGYKVKDVRLLLDDVSPNYVHLELQCFCEISVCCFISEMELHKSWFKSIE